MRTAPARRSGRTWDAVATGAAAGLVVATAALWGWIWLRPGDGSAGSGPPPREVAQATALFRMTHGGEHEMLLVTAGPDAAGEPALAKSLFAGEDPPRELASVVVANLSQSVPWDVDLRETPLRCRAGSDDWLTLESVGTAPPKLEPAAELRLRALGGTGTAARLEPGSLRQFLVALPPSRKLDDLAVVQWGDVQLVRDRFDLERLRRFRANPAGLSGPRR